jgi:uncharacterized protein YkwD
MRAPNQLIIVMLMALLLLMLPNKFMAQPGQHNNAATPAAVLSGINDFRVAHGLGKLQLDSYISQLAKEHSALMAQHKIEFGHGGFSDRTHHLYKKFPRAPGMAENVAYADVDNTNPIVHSWLTSSGHRRNILGNFNLTGIGVAHDANGRVYVTQIFVKDTM